MSSATGAQVCGCGTRTIDLNGGAAGTDVRVSMSAAGPLVALFNAECSVKGTTDTKWLDIDVYIDGVRVAPSNGDNAFCTSTGDNALQHWVSASTNVVRRVGAGIHTVRVRGTLRGCVAGDRWRIDDISTIGFRGL